MNHYEFAINMELNGEKYYLEQAAKNADNSLGTVFLMLARDERNHAAILQNKFNAEAYELKDNHILHESKDVFKEVGRS
jgi:rubrerythrin